MRKNHAQNIHKTVYKTVNNIGAAAQIQPKEALPYSFK